MAFGRLRFLLEKLRACANREGYCFGRSEELLELHFMDAVSVQGRAVEVDGLRGWMTTVAPGDVAIDFQPYAEMRLVFDLDAVVTP